MFSHFFPCQAFLSSLLSHWNVCFLFIFWPYTTRKLFFCIHALGCLLHNQLHFPISFVPVLSWGLAWWKLLKIECSSAEDSTADVMCSPGRRDECGKSRTLRERQSEMKCVKDKAAECLLLMCALMCFLTQFGLPRSCFTALGYSVHVI